MLSHSKNPLGLEIGERITFTHYSDLVYDGDDKVHRRYKVADQSAVVVGTVVKCTGTYHKGHSYVDLDGGGYDPAEFKTKSRIRFYEVRRLLWDKPFLVHPDDIILEK